MIIANPISKTSISIPLETFPAQVTPPSCVEQEQQQQHPVPSDGIKFINRYEGDFVDMVFGKNHEISNVEQVLSITTTTNPSGPYHQQRRTFQSQACIHQQTVFLSSPFVGTSNIGSGKWAATDFQSCITHLIDLAEEATGCSEMVVAIDKHDKIELNTILRAFMYLGFELLNPSLYNQDPGFTLVGYEF